MRTIKDTYTQVFLIFEKYLLIPVASLIISNVY